MPKLLFLVVIFLALLFLAISCSQFSMLPLNKKGFLSNLIIYLWNVLHATHLPSVVALATLGTKKLPTDLSFRLETYFDAEVLPAANKCSLFDLCATATSPCILHICTLLYATLHSATHLCLSHCCSVHALLCPRIPCTIALLSAPSASISTHSVNSYYSTSELP